jgi:hypothetical protein
MEHIQAGVVVAARGSAIVVARINELDEAVVVAVDRLAVDLDAVVDRMAELRAAYPRVKFAIDAEGLGTALYRVLVPRREGSEPFRLYGDHGLERQKLVDALVVLVHFDQLRFAAGLEHQDAMTKALLAYNREVREDGNLGSELVTALCLAITKPPVKRGGFAFVATW